MKSLKFIISIIVILCVVALLTTCTKPNSGNEDENNTDGYSGINNGYAYVDLGLPSGTLWATCNVGATTPEDIGDHFAWGEVEPKTIYLWDTYQWCNNSDNVKLTKYCPHSEFGYDGFTDSLTVLQFSDDAAASNWGIGWRIPTVEQWRELRDNTAITWTTQNGVRGCQFSASNGNSIFLPSSGYRWYDQLRANGNAGHYWSSSLVADYPNNAWFFYYNINMDDYTVDSYNRFYGRSVRPVCSTYLDTIPSRKQNYCIK